MGSEVRARGFKASEALPSRPRRRGQQPGKAFSLVTERSRPSTGHRRAHDLANAYSRARSFISGQFTGPDLEGFEDLGLLKKLSSSPTMMPDRLYSVL